MSATIDLRTMPANVPVLCIPRVYSNISESRIRRILNDLDMGTIDHIDMVSKSNDKGEKFNRVFIHYHHWNNSDNANNARERLLNGKEIKIIYDEPWFWKVSAYRESKTKQVCDNTIGHKKKSVVSIKFDSDEEEKPTRTNNDRPRYEDKPRPRYEDKPRPRYEDKPKPRYEDKPKPRYEDKPRPRYEDKPRPRYEDKPRPRYEDKPRPRYEDKPKPIESKNDSEIIDKELEKQLKQREEDKIKMKEHEVDYGKKIIPNSRRPVKIGYKNKDKTIKLEEGEVIEQV
jgi:hypothetical protein